MNTEHDVVELCTCTEVHPEAVAQARKGELPVPQLLSMSELFKILGDPTRLRMVNALAKDAELCVCDLSRALDMTQSAISHQLSLLRRARLVQYRKEGKVVYYRLDDDHVERLVSIAAQHVAEQRSDVL
jgi:DNA-binding transcriptional ArsR family regulator